MLVNKNRPGKAITSPGNTALSNEIFTQKSIVFYSILDLLLLFFISLDGRENENSLLLQSK